MTIRFSFVWMIGGALAIAALQRGDAAAAGRVVADPGPHSAPSAAVLRIPKGDSITAGQLAELQHGSSIGRDLLSRVASLPNTILYLSGDPLLFDHMQLYGRSRFWVNRGELFGDLRYQVRSLHNFSTQCLIVHELAHALEIASADRREGTAGIRTFMLSRALDAKSLVEGGAETEFPQKVALAVLQDLLGKRLSDQTLDRIAEAYGIALPSRVPESSLASKSHEKAGP